MSDVLAGLNNKQREAVLAPFRPVDVIAGAGAGKTTVLSRRVAYFIEKGIAPENIVAITFTNKAAREMRERISGFLGKNASARIQISTFHSFGNTLLRKIISSYNPKYMGNYTILDDDDRKATLKDVINALGYDEERFSVASVGRWIEKQKCFLVPPEKAHVGPRDNPISAQVYDEYEKVLVRQNMVDFDDLIFKTVLALRRNEAFLAATQERVKALLIDEYQDTNDSQHALAKMVSAKHRNIFVVGDPDQSIYGFRFADIRILLNFKKDFPDAVEIKLEQNYRSTGNILVATNALIQNNTSRIEKELWTQREDMKNVKIFTLEAENESEEAFAVASAVAQEHRSIGIPWRGFAVLYRQNVLSKAVEMEFIRRNIPHVVLGGMSFLKRSEVKDVMSFLRLAQNPRDLVSLKRIINVPKRSIGSKSQKVAIDEIGKTEGGFFGDISKAVALLPPKAGAELKKFQKQLMAFKKSVDGGTALPVAVSALLKELGYTDMYERQAKKSSIYETKLENVENLIELSSSYTQETPTLVGFIEHIALMTDAENDTGDKVQIMTCHRAKGLEFPSVFVVGVEEGFMPCVHEFTKDELEEERRIAYVAMTRAKDRLHLSFCGKRTVYGKTTSRTPSRFLDEIPQDLLQG